MLFFLEQSYAASIPGYSGASIAAEFEACGVWSEACRTRDYSSVCNLVVTKSRPSVHVSKNTRGKVFVLHVCTPQSTSLLQCSAIAALHMGPRMPYHMAMKVSSTHGSERAYIAVKWYSVIVNLATKCTENVRRS